MEIVRQLDRNSAIEKMRERGYGIISENISEKYGNTIKTWVFVFMQPFT